MLNFKITSVALLLIVAFFAASECTAQTNQVAWLSPKFNYTFDQNWSAAARPIERMDLSEPDHIDISLDLSVARKLGKGFGAQLLSRYFLRPEGAPDRIFIFSDVFHSFRRGKWGFKNTLRHHLATNWRISDPDFLRYQPKVTYHLNEKAFVFLQNDWWLQLGGENAIRRVRYQIGYQFKCDKRTALNMQYWREESLGLEPKIKSNIFVLTLIQKYGK